MIHPIDVAGGTVAVARMLGMSSPGVTVWRRRGVPVDRCPAIEMGSDGKVSCELLRPDARWVRVPDPTWPWHPEGRPLLDLATIAQASAPEGAEVRDAA